MLKKLHPLVQIQFTLYLIPLFKLIILLCLDKTDAISREQAVMAIFPIDVILYTVLLGLTIYIDWRGVPYYPKGWKGWFFYPCCFAPLIALMIFSPASKQHENQSVAQKWSETECRQFYDTKKEQATIAWENYDEAAIKKLEEEGKRKEAWALALMPFAPLFEISDMVDQCREKDGRYYQGERDLCAAFSVNNSWNSDVKKRMFEEFAKPYFCEPAFLRGDTHIPMIYAKYYSRGYGGVINYGKAIYEFDRFIELHKEQQELEIITAQLHRENGNKKRSYELISKYVGEGRKKTLHCQLSLHYRQGIGIEANIKKADDLLAEFEEVNPDKDCKLQKDAYFFGQNRKRSDTIKRNLESEN